VPSSNLVLPLIRLPGSSPRKDGEKFDFTRDFANRHHDLNSLE
jgi:hypothetical protein